MKGLALPFVSAVAIGCIAADTQQQTVAPPTPKQLEAAKPVQQAMNDFTFRLTKEVLKGESGNVCISPLSVSICLSTLLNGAQNQTFEDLRRTLSYSKLSMEQINDGTFATVSSLLNAKDKPFTIANSAWLKTEYTAKPSYVRDLQKYYNAEFFGVKSFDDPVLKQLNDWTKEKTKGRIDKLFDSLDPATSLVLANALTFDGEWATPFKVDRTSNEPFVVQSGQALSRPEVPTMHGHFDASFYEKDGLKALRLPYKGDEFSMVFILPSKASSPHQYVANLDAAAFQTLLKNLHRAEVDISIPKFKVEATYSLNDSLSALGMASLFQHADLGGITQGDFNVSQVVHKTYLKLDEKGTEAAAATGVAVTASAQLDPPSFRADRPFAYFLVNNTTGTILFVGICSDPR